MALRALLVSHDEFVEAAFQDAVRGVGAELEVSRDSKSALLAVERTRFDVVLIDCDDVYGGASLLRSTRTSLPNRCSVLLAITNGGTHAADAIDLGANLVACKPITPERAESELQRACKNMVGTQRANRRFSVSIPVFLSFGQVLDRRAQAYNVSLGGLGIRVSEPIEGDDVVHLRCCLPSCAISIQARGEIAWADPEGNCGIRFMGMSDSSLSILSEWLQRAEEDVQAS